MVMVAEGKSPSQQTLSDISNGWAKKTIKVKLGGDNPNVMQMVKAFHSTWPTSAVQALLDEAGDRRFVTNDVTECDDCSGNVFVDCDDFGFASFDDGNAGSQRMQARVFQRNNGHKLFAICFEEGNGTGMPVCCLYDFNPANQVMTPEQAPYSHIDRKWPDSYIHCHLGYAYDQTVIMQETSPEGEYWYHHYPYDGMNHVYLKSGEDFFESEYYDSELPEDAVLKDENDEWELYLSPEIFVEVINDELSIWVKNKESGEVTFIVTTNSLVDPRWDTMTDGNAIPVPMNTIAVGECQNCFFIPWNYNLIFIEGCPDGRNVWSYIINIQEESAIQLPTNEGLIDIDFEDEHLLMGSYGYRPEGGRYSVLRVYSTDGTSTGQEYKTEE